MRLHFKGLFGCKDLGLGFRAQGESQKWDSPQGCGDVWIYDSTVEVKVQNYCSDFRVGVTYANAFKEETCQH